MRITDIMADFLDSIRAYEHESGEAIHYDERESSEFVDMYFNNEKQEGIELTEKLINIIMKNYRLKQWYPSLAISWRTDDRYEYDAGRQVMTNISNVKNGLAIPKEMAIKEQELHPDFWELIEEKKPLFITEDGVEVFEVSTQKMFVVRLSDCEKFIFDTSVWSNISNESKVYYHESNADEYIWRNMRLFSYNDIEKYQSGGEGVFYDIKSIAKERSKQ